MLTVAMAAALGAAAATACGAQQDLRARIAAAGDADLTFHFAAREGVCGAEGIIVRKRPGGNSISMHGNWDDSRSMDDMAAWCRTGPVQVRLRTAAGTVTDVRIAVGPDAFPDAQNFGDVPGDQAVTFLVNDVARSAARSTASRALQAANMAAADSWPAMLALARDEGVNERVRKQATNHVAAEASDRLLANEPYIDDELEIRRQAVFALSRRKDDASRVALRDLARSGPEPAVRAAALYWLGTTDGADALDLLESVLRR